MNGSLKKYRLTDQGNAELFADQHKDSLMYAAGIGWKQYRDGRWAPCAKGEEVERAKATVRSMYAMAAGQDNHEYRIALAEHATKCESEKRLMGMIRLAQSEADLVVSADELDADPFDLNVLNGTIDLRTGKLRPHDPADRITKQSPVVFDRNAKCPHFLRFLSETFAGDELVIAYVRRLLGNAISGDASTQYLPIFHGAGANGKSTLLSACQFVLGDYAGIAPDSLLTLSKRQEHPCEVADLHGLRLVIASETEAGAKLRTQLVKKLVGEVRLKARRMYGEYFEFPRTHHIILQTNNRPRISEDSEAVWRRIRLVPFNVTVAPEDRDPHLLEKLKQEAPGILAWLVYGCLEWQREGLEMPDAVRTATEEYREESDPLGDFLADRCILEPYAVCPTSELRRAYEQYCGENGLHPVGGRLFAQRLVKHGCQDGRSHSGRFWKGIELISSSTPVFERA